MIYTVLSLKGGVGKTAISYFLSKHLEECIYTTNDLHNSSLVEDYDRYKKIGSIGAEDMKRNIVFDTGGYIDENLKKTIIASYRVIVVVENNKNSKYSIKKAIEYFKTQDKKFMDKLYVVCNKASAEDMEELKVFLNEIGIGEDRIIRVSHSKLLAYLENNNYSLSDINVLLRGVWKKHIKELEYLLRKFVECNENKYEKVKG